MFLEKIIDHRIVRNRAFLRKGLALALEPMSRMERRSVSEGAFLDNPPVIANSLPKSGTHLLLQVTRALPSIKYRSRFIATSPSLTLLERTPAELARKIARILPGETLGAHLYHSPEVARAIEAINAVNLFIYRDPRDVIVSEVFYLTAMNRWHRMHKHFKNLPDEKARLTLALNGLDDRYPEANARLLPYAPWREIPGVIAIRYEDLSGPRQAREIERVVEAWRLQGGNDRGIDDLVDRLASAIDPSKSHTFRNGGSGKWRRGLSDFEADEITHRLAPAITAFGYSE